MEAFRTGVALSAWCGRFRRSKSSVLSKRRSCATLSFLGSLVAGDVVVDSVEHDIPVKC